MSEELELIQTIIQTQQAHKEDIDRQLQWQDRRMRQIQSAQLRIEANQRELVQTTNHRLDDFQKALGQKADLSSLPGSIVSQLRHTRFFWPVSAAILAVLLPVIIDHWGMFVGRWMGGF